MNPSSPPSVTMLAATLLVALGGATGAVLRYHGGRLIGAAVGLSNPFPWPTLAINVFGSFAMGLLAGWLARYSAGGESWRLLLGVGVLGGFTTFSAFSLEVVMLAQKGQIALAAAYATGSVIAGATGLMAGLMIMRGATI
ncbi:fluoride efflux transporter CrcB [Novosphingobium lentum]|uniref:fluoride efflux transporter CrcB n=1 Tax=Novosphingobium lentum TaxID=145287 RepID=UPI000A5A44CF|nr:fluoride efflux transporter CrcB [Novosphingobium lentum]